MNSISWVKVLAFTMLGPFIVSVLFGVIRLPIPTELTVYVVSLLMIIIINEKSNRFKIVFLKNNVAIFSYTFLLIIIYFVMNTISTEVVYSKIVIFIYLVVVKIIILSLIDYKTILSNYEIFLKYIKQMSIFILFIYFILFYIGFTQSFDDTEGNQVRIFLVGIANPIWFSRFVVDLMFIILFYSFYKRRIKKLDLLSIVLGLTLLFESGSRGPFLALFLISFLSFLNFNDKKRKVIYWTAGLSMVIFLPFILPKILDFNIFSVLARLNSYEKSIDYIINNPFGYGIGSFGLLYSGEDIARYPHNILFEIFVEMGFIGFITFMIILYYGFKSYCKENIFFYLFLISLINAQLSGSLSSNTYMFSYLFLSIVYKKFKRNDYYEKSHQINNI